MTPAPTPALPPPPPPVGWYDLLEPWRPFVDEDYEDEIEVV